jgi:hypothetical protein
MLLKEILKSKELNKRGLHISLTSVKLRLATGSKKSIRSQKSLEKLSEILNTPKGINELI